MYDVAPVDLDQVTEIWVSVLVTSTKLDGAIGIATLVVTVATVDMGEVPALLIAVTVTW